MSSAKITTVGFYQYMNAYNDDLFGLLHLPTGIDKDTLVNNILLRGGEFEVVYSNPDFYKSAIGLWSNKHYRTFEKWINALNMNAKILVTESVADYVLLEKTKPEGVELLKLEEAVLKCL